MHKQHSILNIKSQMMRQETAMGFSLSYFIIGYASFFFCIISHTNIFQSVNCVIGYIDNNMVIQCMNMFRYASSSFLYNKALAHYNSGGKRRDIKLSDTETKLWRESYYEKG